jgi:hypothetical protein
MAVAPAADLWCLFVAAPRRRGTVDKQWLGGLKPGTPKVEGQPEHKQPGSVERIVGNMWLVRLGHIADWAAWRHSLWDDLGCWAVEADMPGRQKRAASSHLPGDTRSHLSSVDTAGVGAEEVGEAVLDSLDKPGVTLDTQSNNRFPGDLVGCSD